MDNNHQIQIIESKIFSIRGQQVMLDKDLAALYQVTTKRLNEQVKRNIQKFPSDFMFQRSIFIHRAFVTMKNKTHPY